MTTTYLLPLPKLRFCDAAGNPLVGGKLFTYLAGTTTKQDTYTDSTGGTPNANPVILDSRGEASVWGAAGVEYKLVLSLSTDSDPPSAPIWTQDNVSSIAQVSAAMEAVVSASTLALARVALGLTDPYVSSDTAITLGGLSTFAHSFGAIPYLMQVHLVNVTGEYGYVTNNVYPLAAAAVDPNIGGFVSEPTRWENCAIYADTSNVYVKFNPTGVRIARLTTNTMGYLTVANWKFRAIAWR